MKSIELASIDRIILTTPYFLTLPAIVARSDIIAAIPSRLAREFANQGLVDVFELPIANKPLDDFNALESALGAIASL